MNATDSPDLTVLAPPDSQSSPTDAKPPQRKIAKLPKTLRDIINSMLDDAASAREIIQKLDQCTDPALPYPITDMDISRWKHSGYLRYLARQERLALVQINREDATEMVTAGDTATIPEATMQIIASQYYECLGDLDPQKLKEKLSEDPLKYTRFLNVFSRITREIMNIRKYRDACAQARAELKKVYDPNRKLTDSERLAIVRHVDDILGIRMPDPDPEPQPNPEPQPASTS